MLLKYLPGVDFDCRRPEDMPASDEQIRQAAEPRIEYSGIAKGFIYNNSGNPETLRVPLHGRTYRLHKTRPECIGKGYCMRSEGCQLYPVVIDGQWSGYCRERRVHDQVNKKILGGNTL